MPEIVGHRGYAGRAPENTLASLDLAIRAGADAVEFDVRPAAGGTPILFHDRTLERTSDGEGLVQGLSLERLRRLDAGGWFSPDFRGERVPTLAEALERVRGRVGRVFCELKACREAGDVDRAVELVRSVGMLGSVVFISLEWGMIERVAELDPAASIGFVLDDASTTEDALRRIERRGRGMLDADARVLLDHPDVARRAVEAGVELGAWTVNEVDVAEELARRGVTSFTTDEVERLVAWRRERGGG